MFEAIVERFLAQSPQAFAARDAFLRVREHARNPSPITKGACVSSVA
ncbi:hypothetical protein [Corallococcus sp. CA041A]|nr:hypothetical protein [Corallococcus sp. CA041A]